MPVIKFPDRQIFNDLTYFQDALRDSGRYHIFEVVAFIDRARRMQAAFIEAPYFPIEFSEISVAVTVSLRLLSVIFLSSWLTCMILFLRNGATASQFTRSSTNAY